MASKASKKNRLPRLYADACKVKGREFWDYEKMKVKWGNLDDYEVVKKIGRGKYSEVFAGFHIPTDKKVVIKILKPVKKKKVKREIKICQAVSKGPNIVALLDVVRDPLTRTPCLVYEFVNSQDWKTLYPTFAPYDIKFYMYKVLQALDYSHSQGLMHRDIKPHNIMIDHEKREVRVIDWGLAEFYLPLQDYNVRVASRHYKGPELLVDDTLYDYSLDIWGFGCMLAGMTFRKDTFFAGADNVDQLYKIAKVLGTDLLTQYLDSYDLELELEIEQRLGKMPRKPWETFKTKENEERCSPEALDLIDKCLRYDPAARVLAKEAMAHAFFEEVRKKEGI
ncbi:unnamed protein product [Polarella glacialis]|uniref:non-specific serine/threonine protein kinase n=1 Tax=Polarella glacialis TaxID=89957 RepID=A0A813IE67_POLGL|nr:unnamed protein product [Polarella glacialis]CAE8649446.1 unnamed protein product [Polarella glacialis]